MDAVEIDSLEAQLGKLETQLEKVTSTEIEQLESENRKLEYRLESVKRAIEQEAKSSVPTSAGEIFFMKIHEIKQNSVHFR